MVPWIRWITSITKLQYAPSTQSPNNWFMYEFIDSKFNISSSLTAQLCTDPPLSDSTRAVSCLCAPGGTIPLAKYVEARYYIMRNMQMVLRHIPLLHYLIHILIYSYISFIRRVYRPSTSHNRCPPWSIETYPVTKWKVGYLLMTGDISSYHFHVTVIRADSESLHDLKATLT